MISSRWFKVILLTGISVLFLVSCSGASTITLDELSNNIWVTNLSDLTEDGTSISAELTFYANSLDIDINPDDIWEMYLVDNPDDDDEFTRGVMMMFLEPYLSQSAPITLENNELTIVVEGVNEGKDAMLTFDLSKDEDKVLAELNQNKSDTKDIEENIVLVLSPK